MGAPWIALKIIVNFTYSFLIWCTTKYLCLILIWITLICILHIFCPKCRNYNKICKSIDITHRFVAPGGGGRLSFVSHPHSQSFSDLLEKCWKLQTNDNLLQFEWIFKYNTHVKYILQALDKANAHFRFHWHLFFPICARGIHSHFSKHWEKPDKKYKKMHRYPQMYTHRFCFKLKSNVTKLREI